MVNVLATVVLFFLIFSLFGLLISVRPPRIHSPITPSAIGLRAEAVTLETSDGLHLKGWFVPQPQSQKVIIGLHGYPADKGDILPALLFLQPEFNLLFFDFRYFGESQGFYTTVGGHEVKDLLAAVRFLKDRGFERIGVWGFSMGGAVALMASSETEEIGAIVSESSFAELFLMARETYRFLFFLKYPLAELTGLWAKLFLGINLHDVSPVKKIQNSHLPILIIHSRTDQVIPFSNAVRIKKALANNTQAEFWFKDGLGHGELGREYEKRVRGFFEKHL